jgi:hypothetical protein
MSARLVVSNSQPKHLPIGVQISQLIPSSNSIADVNCYFWQMNKRNIVFQHLIISLLFIACKKEEQQPPQATDFTYTAADSLVFEHSGTLPYAVAIQSTSGKSFISSFSGFYDSFYNGSTTLNIPSNESRSFNITFNQFGVNPGVYPCILTVAVPNENNAVKTQTVQMVYRPNCGYSFRNYTIAEITYEINGILLNKSITCTYNANGQLEIIGLMPFTVLLNVDCSNLTVSMEPLVHLGNLVTCTGTIEGSEIMLQFFNDGTLSALGRIKQ